MQWQLIPKCILFFKTFHTISHYCMTMWKKFLKLLKGLKSPPVFQYKHTCSVKASEVCKSTIQQTASWRPGINRSEIKLWFKAGLVGYKKYPKLWTSQGEPQSAIFGGKVALLWKKIIWIQNILNTNAHHTFQILPKNLEAMFHFHSTSQFLVVVVQLQFVVVRCKRSMSASWRIKR